MKTTRDDDYFRQFIYRGWSRDRDGNIHTGEALMLACLVKTRGTKDADYKDVQAIMRDINA